MRLGDVTDLFGLAHQLVIDVQPARGVEQDHVVAAQPARLHRARGDLLRRLALDDGQRVDARLLAQHLELLLCRRAPRVERGHQHLALVALVKALGELRGCRRLAGALQADHHDRHRRRRIQVDRLGLGA